VETIEVGGLERRVVGLTAENVGLTLAKGKSLLGELGRLVLQTQMEEFATCARMCGDCLKLRRPRDQRTCKAGNCLETETLCKQTESAALWLCLLIRPALFG
jgi:hypothetical protein